MAKGNGRKNKVSIGGKRPNSGPNQHNYGGKKES